MDLSKEALDEMLESAAKRGALQALLQVGLNDANAGRDIGELRSLLDAWRSARQTVVKSMVATIGRAFIYFVLIAILYAVGAKTGFVRDLFP